MKKANDKNEEASEGGDDEDEEDNNNGVNKPKRRHVECIMGDLTDE